MAQKVLDLDASNGHAWHTMGQMEEKKGKLDAALGCYTAGQQGSGESACILLIVVLARHVLPPHSILILACTVLRGSRVPAAQNVS